MLFADLIQGQDLFIKRDEIRYETVFKFDLETGNQQSIDNDNLFFSQMS